MSSLATSSPVSASTLEYLMRCPVFLLIWLKETFSASEVAGYSATGQVTRDSRKKPFQLARGAMAGTPNATDDRQNITRGTRLWTRRARTNLTTALTAGRSPGDERRRGRRPASSAGPDIGGGT